MLALADAGSAIVKLRAWSSEQQTHRETWSYPEIMNDLVARHRIPADAVGFVGGSMHDALRRSRGLATVSSTAALEAIAMRRPTLIISDFGVSAEMINFVFEGSGCLGTLDDLRCGGKLTIVRPMGPRRAMISKGSASWTISTPIRAMRSSFQSAFRRQPAAYRPGDLFPCEFGNLSPLAERCLLMPAGEVSPATTDVRTPALRQADLRRGASGDEETGPGHHREYTQRSQGTHLMIIKCCHRLLMVESDRLLSSSLANGR